MLGREFVTYNDIDDVHDEIAIVGINFIGSFVVDTKEECAQRNFLREN